MELNKNNFYNILYDPEDFIAIKNRKPLGKNEDGIMEFAFLKDNRSLSMLINGDDPEYICLNPVDIESDGSALSSNIFTYRNILMECDEKGVDIEQQRYRIKQSGIPYSTVVFSGGKSSHHIISLEESLSSEEEYKAWFKAIEFGLSKYNFKADSACKNPSRLSRTPEGFNIKDGNPQELLEVRSRIPNKDMLVWFKQHDIDPNDYLQNDVEYTSYDGPNSANDERRWEVAQKFMGQNWDYSSLGDGEREPARFQLTLKCKECGLSMQATQNYMVQNYPSSKGSAKTVSDVKRVYDTREVTPIAVSTEEDWIKLQQLKKTEETHTLYDNLLDLEYNLRGTDEIKDEEIDRDSDATLHRYMMVGDQIYFLVNRRIYKRSLSTFTIHHRKADLQSIRRYTGECNEPGYFNYQPVVNNHYNMFKMPTWKPTKGSWDTIEHYLRHLVDQDELQYQMLLDYFQISLENPKQKLPIIILLSYEKNTGKSTFYDLLKSVFGENVESVDPSNFELDWNTQWCEKHFVFVDEMEKVKDKDKIGSKLKKLAYFPVISKNKKGYDTETIEWNGRTVLTSNEEAGFIEIDNEEDRYWVIKPPGRKGEFDPNYVDKIRADAPYFVHALMNRTLHTENENRGWFKKELLHTRALQDIVDNSRPQIEVDLDNMMTVWFEDNKNKSECNFILDTLTLRFPKYTIEQLKTTIHKLFGVAAASRRMKEDSFHGFNKIQKFWYTINRTSISTNEDFNDSIADAFKEIS